ncbi:MAG: c-type cytochrome, partial [Bryobacteraceae bacterium]
MFHRFVPLLLVWSFALEAHDPITTKLTWSREISRLFIKRCASCHSDGGAAPMPLTSYEEARPWATAIKEEVLERRMPPWGAVKGFGHFRNDAGLSQEEINIVAEWVEGGAPEGDPQYRPAWRYPPAAEASHKSGISVRSLLTLARAVVLDGIRAKSDADSVQVAARRPDGSIV